MITIQQELGKLLDDLLTQDGMVGAALISRDGLTVKAVGRPEMHRETFSAMTATLMGAAEIALGEFDGGKARTIVASTDRVQMVLMGASRDLLLVAAVRPDAAVDKLLPRLQDTAQRVAGAVGG